MVLKPVELLLLAAVVMVPAVMAWIVIRTVRRVREVNAEDGDQ